ncbi:hypothetical protein CF319_g8796, partial [Tilletia indica]
THLPLSNSPSSSITPQPRPILHPYEPSRTAAGLTASNRNVDISREYYDKTSLPFPDPRSALDHCSWRRSSHHLFPAVTDILPGTGFPPVTVIVPIGVLSISLPGGVLLTTGLSAVTDILPGTGFPAVTDIVPIGVPSISLPGGVLPIRGLPGVTAVPAGIGLPVLTSLLPTATLPGVTHIPPTGVPSTSTPRGVLRTTGFSGVTDACPGTLSYSNLYHPAQDEFKVRGADVGDIKFNLSSMLRITVCVKGLICGVEAVFKKNKVESF